MASQPPDFIPVQSKRSQEEEKRFHQGIPMPLDIAFRAVKLRVDIKSGDGRDTLFAKGQAVQVVRQNYSTLLVQRIGGGPQNQIRAVNIEDVYYGARLPDPENMVSDDPYGELIGTWAHITRNWFDLVLKTPVKIDEYGVIMDHSPDSTKLKIRFQNPGRQSTFPPREQVVPAGIVQIFAPTNAAQGKGRMFRTKTLILNTYGGPMIPVNSAGSVIAVHDYGRRVNIKLLNGSVYDRIPATALDYGAIIKDTIKIDVTDRAPLPASTRAWTEQTSHAMPDSVLQHHIFQLLMDIYLHRDSIRLINQRHTAELQGADNVRRIALWVEKGTQKASPKLINDVFKRKTFSIGDVVTNAKVILPGLNRTAGIYLRAYRDFPTGPFKGDGPYAYAGQTVEMTKRYNYLMRSSRDRKRTEYNSMHGRVLRAARDGRHVQLFELPKDVMQSLGDVRTTTILEIIEVCFFLLLKTYSRKVVDWEIASSTTGIQLENIISTGFHMREIATTLSHIAELSFKNTGWSAYGKRHLGIHDGLNLSTPFDLTSFAAGPQEKTLWSRTYVPKQRMTMYLRVSSPNGIFEEHATGVWVILSLGQFSTTKLGRRNLTCDRKTGHAEGPPPGTRFWIQVEIMDDGAGPHPCPYDLAPDVTPWDNLEQVRQLGILLMWYQGEQLFTRYVRRGRNSVAQASVNKYDQRCAIESYGTTAAFRAYLKHEIIRNRPAFVPDFGQARIMSIQNDSFRQRVTVSCYTTANPRETTMKLDESLAKQAMEASGLLNIGGTFGQLDNRWVSSVLDTKYAVFWNKRTECDACLMTHTFTGLPSGCTQEPGTETCQRCYARGIPCSWTPGVQLLGKPVCRMNRAQRITEDPTQYPEWAKHFRLFISLETKDSAGYQRKQAVPDIGLKITNPNEAEDESMIDEAEPLLED